LPHDHEVIGVAFAPDSTTVITATADGIVRHWNASSQALTREPLATQTTVSNVAYSTDGASIFLASGRVGTLWDLAKSKMVGTAMELPLEINAAAVSPDSRMVLLGTSDGAFLWDVEKGSRVGEVLDRGSYVSSVFFGPVGSLLATGTSERLKLWDRTALRSLTAPLMLPSTNAMSFRNSQSMLIGCSDGSVRFSPIPRPLPDDPERLRLFAEVAACACWTPGGELRELGFDEWLARRDQLDQMGGPLLPSDD
jgi:WD40 repeat protein